jgi:hypothetical protein
MNTQRKEKHCGLCRQPNHNVRKCPQIDVLDAQNLETIQSFLLENSVFSIYEGLRFRFSWLLNKELIELRALSRKHNLAYELMDKRDMYRALKRIYVQNSLRNIEDEFFSNRTEFFHLLSSISYIEYFLIDFHAQPLTYIFKSSDCPEESSECPVCYDEVPAENTIRFNCNHTLCNGCFSKYNFILERDSLNVPKCPICRTTIHTLQGDLETLRANYTESPF